VEVQAAQSLLLAGQENAMRKRAERGRLEAKSKLEKSKKIMSAVSFEKTAASMQVEGEGQFKGLPKARSCGSMRFERL
jgi:hypothetical protein